MVLQLGHTGYEGQRRVVPSLAPHVSARGGFRCMTGSPEGTRKSTGAYYPRRRGGGAKLSPIQFELVFIVTIQQM